MLKILQNIDSRKATQQGDIPVRIIKKPVYKKDDRFDKTNYRTISILPVLSKAFEGCLYDQIYEYIDTILSKVQCGFQKGFSTQYSLIGIIEKWRKIWIKANRALRY